VGLNEFVFPFVPLRFSSGGFGWIANFATSMPNYFRTSSSAAYFVAEFQQPSPESVCHLKITASSRRSEERDLRFASQLWDTLRPTRESEQSNKLTAQGSCFFLQVHLFFI